MLLRGSQVLHRQLEVGEIEMLDGWLVEGIPQRLIEASFADALQQPIRRLRWIDLRLEELVKGHLHQHPELGYEDLDLERSVALSSLRNDEISGHLSKTKRKKARSAVRRARTVTEVQLLIDEVLVA